MNPERQDARLLNLEGDAWKSKDGTDVEVYIKGEPRFLRLSSRPEGSLSAIRDYTGTWLSMSHCEDVTDYEVLEACRGIFDTEEYKLFADQEEMSDEEKGYLVRELTKIFLVYFK